MFSSKILDNGTSTYGQVVSFAVSLKVNLRKYAKTEKIPLHFKVYSIQLIKKDITKNQFYRKIINSI